MRSRIKIGNETTIRDSAKVTWHDARTGKVYKVYSNTDDTCGNRLWNSLLCTKL